MSSAFRTLISTIILIALFGGVYYALSTLDIFNSARVSRADVERRTQQIEQELVAQLTMIGNLSLNGQVFDTEEYTSLVDTSVTLVRPPLERPDPFAAY